MDSLTSNDLLSKLVPFKENNLQFNVPTTLTLETAGGTKLVIELPPNINVMIMPGENEGLGLKFSPHQLDEAGPLRLIKSY